MEFIKENVQWLFSGAGLYFIGALVTIILILLGLRKLKFFVKFEGHVTNKNK